MCFLYKYDSGACLYSVSQRDQCIDLLYMPVALTFMVSDLPKTKGIVKNKLVLVSDCCDVIIGSILFLMNMAVHPSFHPHLSVCVLLPTNFNLPCTPWYVQDSLFIFRINIPNSVWMTWSLATLCPWPSDLRWPWCFSNPHLVSVDKMLFMTTWFSILNYPCVSFNLLCFLDNSVSKKHFPTMCFFEVYKSFKPQKNHLYLSCKNKIQVPSTLK